MKSALVLGAGGFIGGHLVHRLVEEGYYVCAADLKLPEFDASPAHEFTLGNLAQNDFADSMFDRTFDEVYQLAADMGGAGYIFTGEHDAAIMSNSAAINLNVLANRDKIKRVFYSSSACMYPAYNQGDVYSPNCEEASAYPADPDSEYGWEKLFSERLYLAHARNYGLEVRIARYHNIFGPRGAWQGGREKAPAALCRKVAEGNIIEVWGDGLQTRSFLYIDECIEGTLRLMRSDFSGPVNIGSDEMVSVNLLAHYVANVASKDIIISHVPGPQGVRGRTSDNQLIAKALNWQPTRTLISGLEPTYRWIKEQVDAR